MCKLGVSVRGWPLFVFSPAADYPHLHNLMLRNDEGFQTPCLIRIFRKPIFYVMEKI